MSDRDHIHSGRQFTAVCNSPRLPEAEKGKRYRFRAVEHVNIGEGWMCLELDGRLPRGVYWDGDMSEFDFSAAGYIVAKKSWPHRLSDDELIDLTK